MQTFDTINPSNQNKTFQFDELFFPETQILAQIPEMLRLNYIYNSTISHTKPFKDLNLTRYEHSIHAASQVKMLNCNLSQKEQLILQVALLFHDIGHTPGSHSMDRVFAGMKDAPPIGEYGYGATEYHEYHGALLVATGPSSEYIQEILGEEIFGAVIQILTFDDARNYNEKIKTYGPYQEYQDPNKIKQLYELKENLDRTSYLTLDYSRCGYQVDLVKAAHQKIKEYIENIVLIEPDSIAVKYSNTNDVDCFEKILQLRLQHFQHVASHPTSALFASAIQKSMRSKLKERYSYEEVSSALLTGKYQKVYSDTAYQLLFNPNHCITDKIIPIFQINESKLEDAGIKALKPVSKFHDKLSQRITQLTGNVEYMQLKLIHELLQAHSINESQIHFLRTYNPDKNFEYHTVLSNNEIYSQSHIAKPFKSDIIIAVDIQDLSSIELIRIHNTIKKIFENNKWILPNKTDNFVPNPRLFTTPYGTEVLFDEATLLKFNVIIPHWLNLHKNIYEQKTGY